jgi:hypothetical protein
MFIFFVSSFVSFCFFFFWPPFGLLLLRSSKKKGGLVVIKKRKEKGPRKPKKEKRKGMKNQEPNAKTEGYTPLFGMAYNPLSVSAFGYLSLPTLDFDDSHKYTSFM